MPIYIGVNNVKKEAHPMIGYNNTIHTVMSGKCGVSGATKSFYDVSNNIDHVEIQLTSLSFRAWSSGTGWKVLETTKAGFQRYAGNDIGVSTSRDYQLLIELGAGQHDLHVYGSNYVILKNGQKIPLNSLYTINGLAIYYPVYVYTDTADSGGTLTYHVNLFGTDKYTKYSMIEFNMGTDGTGNSVHLYNGQYSSGEDMYFRLSFGKKASQEETDHMTINGTRYHVKVIDTIA